MIVEVNGIKYQSVDEPKRKPLSKMAMAAIMLGSIYSPQLIGGNNNPMPNVDFVKEYGLIKNKQSKLPRSNREYIVWYFEKHFKILEP